MKKLFIATILVFASILTTKAQEKTYTLQVTISGLKSDNGSVMAALYKTKEDFLNKEFKGEIVTIKNKIAYVVFKEVPKGEYAVSFVHDENNNKKMDTNFLGIPKEDYGCSNNARGFMGPPKYKDAKFLLEDNKNISIKIN